MGHHLIIAAVVMASMSMSESAGQTPSSIPEPFQDCPDCPVMVPLPAGRFVMGADDQRDTYGPGHDRAMPIPFAIASTETTFDQYEACVIAGACRGDKSDHGWGRRRQPIINVPWQDAVDYADWLSQKTGMLYRLPTEAEWEYAARAGTVTRYSWGDAVGEGRANCRRCSTKWSGKGTAPVAQFLPNAFGLFDMNGNVSEWVADCWRVRHTIGGEFPDTDADGSACSARVTRSGDWYYVPIFSTSAARKSNGPGLWRYTIGFRVVRGLR
jgi:formylglycine-generating enzyme required for sulfatase activity